MTVEQAKEDRRTPGEIVKYIYDTADSVRQYVAWIETDGEDVMQRIWAYKRTKKAGTQYTEVIRKVLGLGTIYRNLYFTGVGGWDMTRRLDGCSIIAFMRKSEEIGTPYITIEYGIRQKKTLQAHGMMNSNPCEAEWQAIHEWEKMMVKEGTWQEK